MNYKDLIQKPGRRISPKIYYDYDGIHYEINHDEMIKARLFFNANLTGTVMQGLELEVKKTIPKVPIYFENKVTYKENTEIKRIGPFFQKEDPTFNIDSKTYTYMYYDNFLTTMVPYEPINVDYPITLLEYFQKLCITCGFSTAIIELPNGNRILTKDIFENINFTYRDVFTDIGCATGTLFKINNNMIEICEMKNSAVVINDDVLKNQNISLGEHFGPINTIVLTRNSESDSIYFPKNIEDEQIEFKIKDNQLMNDNNREDYIEELYEKLKDIEYDTFDFELTGYGGFDPLQKIEIQTNNQTYYSYVLNNEEEFTQGYSESIYTELPEESKTDYESADTTDRKINQTTIIANKQKNRIDAIVSSVEETKEKLSKIEMDLENIIFSVENSGGNNLVLNSVGFAGLDNWETSNKEKVAPIAKAELQEKSTSGAAFQLNGATISQEITINKNEKYTFSCTIYKAPTSNGYIKLYDPINEEVYFEEHFPNLETINYKKYEKKEFQPKGGSLILEYYGDEASNLLITDTLLTKGDLSSVWTQANGEVLNNEVKINSKGVLVRSKQYTSNGQYTVISPDEFAGYADSKKVFTLNKDTTEVEKIRARKVIAMDPLKIVPITTGSSKGWAFVTDDGGEL